MKNPRRTPEEIQILRAKVVSLLDDGVSKAAVRERFGFGKTLPARYLEGTKYAHSKTR